MSLFPKAPFDLPVCPSMSQASLAAPFSPLPTAALPSMSLSSNAPLKLARCPHSLAASLAALPSISLIPFVPFPHSRRVLYRSRPRGSVDALAPARLSRRGDLDRPSRSFPRLGSRAEHSTFGANFSAERVPSLPLPVSSTRFPPRASKE
jgi:hypothetical protein